MSSQISSKAALVAAVATAALALSACGSNSLSTAGASSTTTTGGSGSSSSGSSSAPASPATKDAGLAAALPAKIRSAGTIVVGTDATYAPNEFLGSDGKTVQGMDVDLFDAIAKAFGVKAQYKPANFDSIILGVKSGKYDLGLSSFTINADREKQVNMVSYFNAGTQWVVAKGNPKKVDPANACGLSIGVQKGTVQIDDLTARSKKCTQAGKKPITQVVEQAQDKVTADVVSGKTAAMLADSPVGLYAVKQTGGKLQSVGAIYDSAPYGIVAPKNETAFAAAIAKALKSLSTSGGYKAALAKWGNQSGAITDFAVNPKP